MLKERLNKITVPVILFGTMLGMAIPQLVVGHAKELPQTHENISLSEAYRLALPAQIFKPKFGIGTLCLNSSQTSTYYPNMSLLQAPVPTVDMYLNNDDTDTGWFDISWKPVCGAFFKPFKPRLSWH